MDISQLRPASELSKQFGVKALVYGGPGTGKTPILKTAPNPVLCAVEPGLLSMRDATNIPTFEAYEAGKVTEFFDWLISSEESKQFDTVGIDSISQIAELFLAEELLRNKDGRKAYGEMSRRIMDLVTSLYYMPNKHIYMIAKQTVRDDNGVSTRSPYFPGQELYVKIPHLYDEILHIGPYNVPGAQGEVIAFRTKQTFGVTARDRSGKLNEFEPPHLGDLFSKCMS